MPDRERRRLTVLDGVILVAALAVGMAGARAYQASFDAPAGGIVTRGVILFTYPVRIRYFGRPAPLLIALSLAVFVLRFLGPRPGLRRLARAPGFAACCAAMVGMALTLLSILIEWSSSSLGYGRIQLGLHYLMMRTITFAGSAIASAWVLELLLGRWRDGRQRDWIEGFGVALGWCWLLTFLATQINV